jgi:hypothetical protein
MPNSDYNSGDVHAAWLSVAATVREFMEKITRLAKGLAPTKRITAAISTIPLQMSDTRIESGVAVDLVAAPEAGAYEFGSGLFATRGPRRKYPINPRPNNRSQRLVFRWQNEPVEVQQKAPHTKDGKVILKHVEHPGVVARPYLDPAFNSLESGEMEKRIMADMDQALGSADDIVIETRIQI